MMDGWVGCKWHQNDVLAFEQFSPWANYSNTAMFYTMLRTYGASSWIVEDRRDQEYFALNGFKTIY